MTIQELHFDFKFKKDKVDTLTKQDFNVAEVDWLLNESQDLVVRRKMGINNNFNKGFENSQKRIDDLKTLHVKFPVQPGIVPTLVSGVYEVDLADLEYDYYYLTRAYADVNDGTCVTRALVKIVQNDDLTEILRDPFSKPYMYEIPANFGKSTGDGTKGSIYLYPGVYTIDNVFLEYIKKPQRMSFGDYTYIDGEPSVLTECELPEHLHPELVTQAVELASLIVNDPNHPMYKEYYRIAE